MAQTLITILNWNNAPDTIECIRSVIALDDVHIAVMDNNSSDNSLVVLREYLRSAGGYIEVQSGELKTFEIAEHKITLVASPANSGFASGNNIMLQAALNTGAIEFIWLLNNDAVATPSSLAALLEKMQQDKDVAFVGSVILDGTRRELIQCCGVTYYKWLGISKLIFKNKIWDEHTKQHIPYGRIDFQNGASLLVRLSALRQVGLMDERFFLYSEEHDWQYTALEKGFRNVLAEDSIVYHKGSVSTNNKKHLFFYYYNKSAIIFARKHNPFVVTVVSTILQTGVMLIRTKFYPRSIYWGFKGIFEGWSVSLK